jgi:hypothetical protein
MRGKPGSKEEQRRKAAMRELGCIACILDGVPEGQCYEGMVDIHHFTRNNKKMGEWATVPLHAGDDGGHHVGNEMSWHKTRTAFRARYGSDLELIQKVNDELARRGLYP